MTLVIEPARRQWNVTRQQQSHVMVQHWAGSHDLPWSDQTLGPQVPVLTTVTGMCVCYIACENSAFSLQLFPAYVFWVLFFRFLARIFGCPTVRKFCEFIAAIAGLLLSIVVCLSLSGVLFIYFLRQTWVYSCFVLCCVWATACTCVRLLGKCG